MAEVTLPRTQVYSIHKYGAKSVIFSRRAAPVRIPAWNAKSVQQAAAFVLEAIFEADFLDFSPTASDRDPPESGELGAGRRYGTLRHLF